jgi:hypothetical protein
VTTVSNSDNLTTYFASNAPDQNTMHDPDEELIRKLTDTEGMADAR